MAFLVFPFNSFQANTYLWFEPSGDCLLIDATFQSLSDWMLVAEAITSRGLHLKKMIITHYHFDHVLGVSLFKEQTGLPVLAHSAGNLFFDQVVPHAAAFGLRVSGNFAPTAFVSDQELLPIGKSQLKVLYTPGHANGSICLHEASEGILFTGDVLFHESIGRTDLPTGDYATLVESVTRHLFTLPDSTIVLPGHGPKSTIGHEKRYNPFI